MSNPYSVLQSRRNWVPSYARGKGSSALMRYGVPLGSIAAGTAMGAIGNYLYPKKKSGRSGYSSSAFPAQAKVFRRRPKRKSKKRLVKGKKLNRELNKMSNAIKDLKLTNDATIGTMVYRRSNSQNITCAKNEQASLSRNVFRLNQMQGALSNLKFFNPSTPGTLTTADLASATFQQNILFKNVSSKINIRNNYISDCEVKVYLCTVKDDTNSDPKVAWQAGIADGGNAADENELNQYPSDYSLVTSLWNLKRMVKCTLSPGQTISASHNVNDIEYDPSVFDSHALDYQKEYKSFTWLVVIQGTNVHDTTDPTSVGKSQCGVDIDTLESWTIQYSAGVNINYIHLANNYDTVASPVQSHQPIPDNINYSTT